MKNKIISFILSLTMLLSLFALFSCSDKQDPKPTEESSDIVSTPTGSESKTNPPAPQKDETVVILYENDVHCAIDGYSKLSAMKKDLTNKYDHVGVVSSGDFVQGGTIGAVSKGEYIINLMNLVGYDALTLGNHEFDYQLPRLSELVQKMNTKPVSCNFYKIGEKESYFKPYNIVSYGDIDIAYIGITTPETISSSTPSQFQNDKGEVIYSFSSNNLYETVQKSIDAAENDGADYVIALSHIGYTEDEGIMDITDIIANTDGLDVVLDAHSHSIIEEKSVKDKNGDNVLLSSTGTKFEYIGKLTIEKGNFDTELIETKTYELTDPAVDAYIKEINDSYSQLGDRKIGESKVDLITHDENDNRLVRLSETNLGNFASDALRIMTNADISYVNGGGLRAPIEKGDITFNDIFSFFPFNNQVITAEVTGQNILDCLELSVMNYPTEDGSFPHVSGMTLSVNTAISSSVVLDSNNLFVKVDGEYRVHNVKILDKASGEYKPLDLTKKYTIAAFNYFLVDMGGGMTMFKDAVISDPTGVLDVELIESYIVNNLNGVIDEKYAAVDNRITFIK